MSHNNFVISDTHFGHTNAWAKFKLEDGVTPLRPFTSTEEMDEHMVKMWNSVVQPNDYVYHLGDVVINKKSLHIVRRLNGHKRLILGNHDIFDNQDYYDAGFEKLAGVRVFPDKFVLSHIPLHPESVGPRFKMNVHGHLHGNIVRDKFGKPDPLYRCVSVEQINYTPLSFDEIKQP